MCKGCDGSDNTKRLCSFFFRCGPLWLKFILDKDFSENIFEFVCSNIVFTREGNKTFLICWYGVIFLIKIKDMIRVSYLKHFPFTRYCDFQATVSFNLKNVHFGRR